MCNEMYKLSDKQSADHPVSERTHGNILCLSTREKASTQLNKSPSQP